MDVSEPLGAILPGVDSAVIRTLMDSTAPRTGREIARSAGRSHPAVQTVLTRFVEQGVVKEEPAGRARVYALNRDHLAAPAFESLASLRTQLFDRIRTTVESWEKKPLHVSIFGSTARRDGSADSDIDLFIVTPRNVDPDDEQWLSQIHGLSRAIKSWTGNHAGVSVVDEGNLKPVWPGESPVARDISRDGIHIFGARIRKILGGR